MDVGDEKRMTDADFGKFVMPEPSCTKASGSVAVLDENRPGLASRSHKPVSA